MFASNLKPYVMNTESHKCVFEYEEELKNITIPEESEHWWDEFHPHRLNESALKQRFGMDGFIAKPEHYNKECILSDAPTEMSMEKRTIKIDYTK